MKKIFLITLVLSVCTLANAQTLVYANNFDNLTPPALPENWAVVGGNWTSSAQNVTLLFPHSAPNYLVSNTGDVNDALSTQQFFFEAGEYYTLALWARGGSGYGTYTLDIDLVDDAAIPNSVSAPVTKNITSSWTKYEALFIVQTSGNYRFVLHAQAEAAGQTFFYPLCIDDFSLSEGLPVVDLTENYPTSSVADIDVNTDVYAVFDHDITLIDASAITLSGATGVNISANGNILTVSHDNLQYGTSYTVNIPAGAIANFSGISWTFTTVGSAVQLLGMFPQNNETAVFPNDKIQITFNQQVNVLDPSLITVSNGIGNVNAVIDGKTMFVLHDVFLRGQTYTLNIPVGAIERFNQAINVTFQTVHSGEISSETHLYGPVTYIVNARGVSDNGRYVTGSSAGGGFMWDVMENGYYLLENGVNGEAFAASNIGEVAWRRYVPDASGAIEPVIWFEKTKNSLPILSYGDIQSITPDGQRACGTVSETSMGGIPAVWDKQPDGSYALSQWAAPPNTTQVRISDISANGNIGVGRILIENHTQYLFEACYWTSPDNIVLANVLTNSTSSEYTCISGNGKYAGLRTSANYYPYIHNLETNTLTQLSGGDIINAITDDGLAVILSGSPQAGGTVPYIYTPTLGLKTFAQFINQDLENIYNITSTIKSQILAIANNSSARIMDISSDGTNWLLQAGNNAYMLHLQKRNSSAVNEVEESNFFVYPNPATNELRIKNYELKINDVVQILDVTGKIISDFRFQISNSINVSALSQGIYFLKINNQVIKFVKQ
ncbi:MAG: T9SS type A sorting domain-containing protein [Prevotellaceae bacterium]|jgi:hypothetical protein|nr:T9SS type A sorting domain-containing protein [Prevotellaceae bacterium]